MSADTSIVVLNFHGYHVALVGAVENFHSPTYSERQRYLEACFAGKPVFATVEEAAWEAANLYQEITSAGGEVEHGVMQITLGSDLRVIEPQIGEPNIDLDAIGGWAYLPNLSDLNHEGEDDYPEQLREY